jgi:putative transposase
MSRAQVAVRVKARALELGESQPPSRASVYRVLESEMEQQIQRGRSRSVGWQGETLILKTREGLEVEVKESNQVWQCDHTRVDLFVVDQVGEVLGRPWLTTIIDTYSRWHYWDSFRDGIAQCGCGLFSVTPCDSAQAV